jgi:hypothetical protein
MLCDLAGSTALSARLDPGDKGVAGTAGTIQNCVHDVRVKESEPAFVPDRFCMQLSSRCQFLY